MSISKGSWRNVGSLFQWMAGRLMRWKKNLRCFLGSGTDEGRNIASISWDNVCKSKEDGGLGVKKLELFNLALCAKWKWRCLLSSASWQLLLRFRYGRRSRSLDIESLAVCSSSDSIWWKSVNFILCVLTGLRMLWLGKLAAGKSRHSGCRGGQGALYWRTDLADSFLSQLTKMKMISDILKTDGKRREWLWNWRRPLFAWEDEQWRI
jgi:hypothetical protein